MRKPQEVVFYLLSCVENLFHERGRSNRSPSFNNPGVSSANQLTLMLITNLQVSWSESTEFVPKERKMEEFESEERRGPALLEGPEGQRRVK